MSRHRYKVSECGYLALATFIGHIWEFGSVNKSMVHNPRKYIHEDIKFHIWCDITTVREARGD